MSVRKSTKQLKSANPGFKAGINKTSKDQGFSPQNYSILAVKTNLVHRLTA